VQHSILEKVISIITEGSLTRFGEIARANSRRIHRVWIVSPWLTATGTRYDPLALIVEALRERVPHVDIVTRPPSEKWHREAINVLRANVRPIIHYNPHLHSKLYILKCDGFQYAMLGSPNLTLRADTQNREIAVEFRSTMSERSDSVASMIDELSKYVIALIAEKETKRE
jgi:phosphatidylserine/phosphatidylglycerophosphate/cardiolipin synthase-like enzyme